MKAFCFFQDYLTLNDLYSLTCCAMMFIYVDWYSFPLGFLSVVAITSFVASCFVFFIGFPLEFLL